MMKLYSRQGNGVRLLNEAELSQADWIDLFQPTEAQVARVEELGITIPSLADMEEIEISNRLYRVDEIEYMTAVLPGEKVGGERAAMPVSFILAGGRLITVRHHTPRPFVTFPDRADQSSLGCHSAERLFMGLTEEIIARLADLLETSGRELDAVASRVFGETTQDDSGLLQQALVTVGREADNMGRVRLGLLTVERMLAFFNAKVDQRAETGKLKPEIKAQLRDIQALEVHADFLAAKVSLTVDTTLGMINLKQNTTTRILSVIAALFLPPTLIASIYGMNFTNMPELDKPWGYPMALTMMVVSVGAIFGLLKWKKWL